jgi:predicted hotdog family 3-hydroxylacyl-ACP dehydratase
MAFLNVSMQSIKQARRERVMLERQAIALFRSLLKSERNRAGLGAHLLSPREREAMARRVKTIEGEILKLRRQIRKLGAGR